MREEIIKEARLKISRYCSYRERARIEIHNKLMSYGLTENEIESLIDELTNEGFLDDERYAKAYAGGKFRIKKWGKLKIRRELKQKQISEDIIKIALTEIEGQSYLETLESVAKKKFELLNESNLYIKKSKVATFLVSKGYESELVWGILNKL